ncbi:MAG: YibE/F family protein [Patescibacteria group bacterium]
MRLASAVLLFALHIPLLGMPFSVRADAPALEQEYLEKAKVLEASASHDKAISGTEIVTKTQSLKIQVLEGPDNGTIISFENDFTQVHAGEVIYIRHIVGGFGTETWAVSDTYRLPVLITLLVIFLLLTLFIGGWQGVRGLASLMGSLLLISSVLLPGIYAGYSAIPVALGVTSLIVILGSYITHGFNRTTSAAVLGMIGTVLVTGCAAYVAVHAAHLSGFTTEQNVYLNFNTNGKIDMIGLLFAGIMIGLLGVLYDIAIGQAIAVEELLNTRSLSKRKVFERSMRIGREHIGALINTLAIAYVGTSLPLLLLFYDATTSISFIINSELFATEIIRILVGSIGLILAVPVVTLIATLLLSSETAKSGHTHTH